MIHCNNISFQYEGSVRPALKNVSLTIKRGEMLAIVGHNGSGKSTIAKHLNGLILPTQGNVVVDGMDTADENTILDIRRRVGMVFQNPDNQLVTSVVEEDVGFGPENLGIAPAEIRTRVDDALQKVGMTEYALKAGHALSGGQKQRIAIAGMIAMQPEVLVLDEATAMLDPQGRDDVIRIVKRLHDENGLTVVMITQYMDEIVGCDRVIVMNDGEICLEGKPREIFRNESILKKIGLDVPETVNLVNELKENGFRVSGNPMTVEETAEAICQSLSKN